VTAAPSHRTTIVIPEAILRRVDELAERRGATRSEVIRELLDVGTDPAALAVVVALRLAEGVSGG